MSLPQGRAASMCATDVGYSLKADGGYEGLFDRGHWHYADGKLTITITHSSEDSCGEDPERPLTPPHRIQFDIIGYNGHVLEAELASAKV